MRSVLIVLEPGAYCRRHKYGMEDGKKGYGRIGLELEGSVFHIFISVYAYIDTYIYTHINAKITNP